MAFLSNQRSSSVIVVGLILELKPDVPAVRLQDASTAIHGPGKVVLLMLFRLSYADNFTSPPKMKQEPEHNVDVLRFVL